MNDSLGFGPPKLGLRRCLLPLLALSALASTTPAAAQAGRVAYVTPSGALATVAPDGGEPRTLGSRAARYQFPAWSPREDELAVIGSDAAGAFVAVFRDEAGAAAEELYRSPQFSPIYLYWSPDGATVSFIAAAPEGGLELHLAPLGGERRVLARGQPFYWAWSADSAELLLHSGFVGEGARLGLSSAERDTLGENLAPPGAFQAPGLSASGDYLAYGELAFGDRGRLVLRTRPGASAPTLERSVDHLGLVALGWSPTEDRLAFISPPQSAPHFYGPLRLLDAESGLLETVTEVLVLAFFWSPDGQHLAYLTVAGGSAPGDVAAAEDVQRVQTSGVQDGGVQVQRAQGALPQLELRLFTLATGKDTLLGSFVPSPLFLTQFLPFFDQYALSHRIWSPDSAALVLPVIAAGGAQVAVFDLGGGTRLLAAGDMPFWSR